MTSVSDARPELASGLEQVLARSLSELAEGPPKLAEAMRYAVFPGGKRLRGLLCLAVADCLGRPSELAYAFAAALELLHCASLVHDDLPCFDDATMRRGQPTVHRAFGQPIAILTGDALIALAFRVVVTARSSDAAAVQRLVERLAWAVGAPHGCIAGQAWESEPDPPLRQYHFAKSATLFQVAAEAAAIVAARDTEAWRRVGGHIGLAFQLADDLSDDLASAVTGKDQGRDVALARPNAVRLHGRDDVLRHLNDEMAEARAAVPSDCRNEGFLEVLSIIRALVTAHAKPRSEA